MCSIAILHVDDVNVNYGIPFSIRLLVHVPTAKTSLRSILTANRVDIGSHAECANDCLQCRAFSQRKSGLLSRFTRNGIPQL